MGRGHVTKWDRQEEGGDALFQQGVLQEGAQVLRREVVIIPPF